jgi:glycosyltransferase involved in cell wall biosynthesis
VSRVSVIIPTHNHARFVGQAIESALAQTLPPREIIIVDDGSTDDTPRVLEGYADRVSVIRQQNQGVAVARNAGVKLAMGDLVAFLDADDVWLPAKLERQVRRFLSEPELGLVHCGMEEIDASGSRLTQKVDGMEGWVADELLLFRRPVILGGGSGAMIPRTVFEEVGGFDTALSTSADWDLYYRIARQYQVGFVAEVLLQYRLHGSNMHSNIRSMKRDMLHGYDKAFNNPVGQLNWLRRRAYGNLHSVLAGSFFSAGDYREFCEHAIKSILLTPEQISHFLGYPLRWWRRHKNVG